MERFKVIVHRCLRGVVLVLFLLLVSCGDAKDEYGVFIGTDPENMEQLFSYKKVVIDAEYYSEEDIETLHNKNIEVYSYLNIGSIETFRVYFEDYKDLILGEYENWNDEFWVDVSDVAWQNHITKQVNALSQKGVDGFFLDNADVYYHYPDQKIFDALVMMIKDLNKSGKGSIINGGDVFITKTILDHKEPLIEIEGINQECVITNIDFENNQLILQEKSTSEYYKKYIESCKEKGLEIYITEYTQDVQIAKKIENFCKERGYQYFISANINLDEATEKS